MSRLVDRIAAYGMSRPWWQSIGVDRKELAQHDQLLQNAISGAPIIVADNVADYLYAGTDQENWHIKTDFPCLAPVFSSFFIEWKFPNTLVSELYGVRHRGQGDSMWPHANAAFVSARDLEEEGRLDEGDSRLLQARAEVAWEVLGQSLNDKLIHYGKDAIMDHLDPTEKSALELFQAAAWIKNGHPLDINKDWKWVVNFQLFAEEKKNAPIMSPGQWAVILDKAGKVVYEQWAANVAPKAFPHLSEQFKDALSGWSTHLFPAFLAVSFLHCKNVKLIASEPDHKLSRAWTKRHNQPLYRYHVLDIEPMKQVLRKEGQSESVGLKKALHICRGHFKDYTNKGLFGKYKGMYWWEAHVRGSLSEGIVAKDYSVKVQAF